ncbi:Phosphatidyl-N-methylethanolamine N-methyltransferase [Escovopsis weberi]|uniref:Phosphatidyl-N-methylethanolamine N-methyltransferase n=1 Tax=Escovopsis weberi TaxID=150374 RepID=A0A0M8N0J5_ESCWE|nr:Phosphatidyl-N-methylethanolamine N-methyltransferase [Escovopsis weberi]
MASSGSELAGLVDFEKQSLWISAASIAFNPLFWNILARQGQTEYHNKILSRTLGGKHAACYALAVSIFSLGIVRDWLFKAALGEQPSHPLLEGALAQGAGYALTAAGGVLVLSSMWALGVTGTYLGDYCGILMDEMVAGFPFSVTSAPMYWGATMSFLGAALVLGKPAGVLLAGEALLGYAVALRFEDPFTAEIYAKRERERAAGKKTE